MKNYENLLKKKVYCDKISFVDKKSTKRIFLDSSMVEHTAVNRGVVGSSPTRGVQGHLADVTLQGVFSFRSALSLHILLKAGFNIVFRVGDLSEVECIDKILKYIRT